MNKVNSLILYAVVSLAGLSACTQNAPPADSLPVPATVVADNTRAPVPAETAPEVNPLADFTVEPGVVYACEGRDRVEATVKWQVKDPAVSTVKVDVDSINDPERKTFAAGGAIGEKRTDDWVVAGVRFHLLDGASGKELATHEVTSLPCL